MNAWQSLIITAMKKQLQSYLTFSKRELNGILVLFILITLILGAPVCYSLLADRKSYDLSAFRAEIAGFKASAVKRNRTYRLLKPKKEEQERQPDYFEFDPNNLNASEWQRLGLSARQPRVIHNYTSKGGKFHRNEDLKKIYSITAQQYEKLEPYIRIKSKQLPEAGYRKLQDKKNESGNKKPEAIRLEINSADSILLDQLRGIGPAFASKIIRYRDRLGGFYSKEQLREVYGIDSLRYVQLVDQVAVDPSLLIKLDINRATFEQLRRHPYLSYKQINAIIEYRRQHGKYTSVGDLKQVLILGEEIIRKIEPYLAFDL